MGGGGSSLVSLSEVALGRIRLILSFYSGIGINRIKLVFNLIGHNSYQVRRKTHYLSYVFHPSHYFSLDI